MHKFYLRNGVFLASAAFVGYGVQKKENYKFPRLLSQKLAFAESKEEKPAENLEPNVRQDLFSRILKSEFREFTDD